jgi:phage-related protein
MAFPTFSPPRAPSPNLEDDTQIDVLSAGFGDGYKQRAPDGLNWHRRRLKLRWNNLSKSEFDQIVSFFLQQQAAGPFYWTPPFETNTKKWVVTGWKREYGRIFIGLTAQFEQSFEIDE